MCPHDWTSRQTPVSWHRGFHRGSRSAGKLPTTLRSLGVYEVKAMLMKLQERWTRLPAARRTQSRRRSTKSGKALRRLPRTRRRISETLVRRLVKTSRTRQILRWAICRKQAAIYGELPAVETSRAWDPGCIRCVLSTKWRHHRAEFSLRALGRPCRALVQGYVNHIVAVARLGKHTDRVQAGKTVTGVGEGLRGTV